MSDANLYGSDVMFRQLSDLDIPYLALVPGSSFRGLHDSIVNFGLDHGRTRPEIILCLHEEHSVAIAHGYAKVTERPMAAIVHDAVGLMHAVMAIYNAHCDRMPVLIVGGTGPLDAHRRRPWIDWIHTTGDEAALIRPFVKFDDRPASVQAALQSLIAATIAADRLPKGPAYVCLDSPLQLEKITLHGPGAVRLPDTQRYIRAAQSLPRPSSRDVSILRQAIRVARRPLFLFGRVNRSTSSWNNRIKLAERYNARVLTGLRVAAAFPTQHRLHAAPPALFLSPQQIKVIQSATLIVSFDWVDLAGTLKTAFPENGLGEPPEEGVRVVHISLDDPAIHDGWTKTHFAWPPLDVLVSADVDETVSALLVETPHDDGETPVETRTEWPSPLLLPATTTNPTTPSTAQHEPTGKSTNKIFITDLAHALYTATPPSTLSLLRLPTSFHGSDLHLTHPLSYLGRDGGEGVGSGPGNAVGSALALRDRHSDRPGHTNKLIPVAILGDGDFLMGCSALWSATHYPHHSQQIPLLIVVANNKAYLNDKQHQAEVARQRGRPVENAGVGTTIDDPAPDLTMLAQSLGATTVADGLVEDKGELEGVLREAVAAVRGGKVVVVDIFVWPDEELEGGP
ncbi:thiamine diphosphate-binding protein [Parathielavia hyrcaniae]|uniref:Thiamine diphosphate-binding protein n=1 Tax=Parathielavia hyrcaniae TaxID=113614 RepID=A0AAN6PWF4_9PEZI|nr:thiamine diphosphate-binding protein [Parathielavia hyrcaniae]